MCTPIRICRQIYPSTVGTCTSKKIDMTRSMSCSVDDVETPITIEIMCTRERSNSFPFNIFTEKMGVLHRQ
ncbi:hypothetical protein Agabi119p4_7198 [Agaricus bisporus var. burnettii]|uniref:Uncharacterized protein n=1 Tax=Agaricus bisporus var. burnettii TaxID=192524 RepID=A0A8H7C7P9_AGABI|nr:hypothetical protein Agabi119p4_7198 [Agaricus bisporus var. burnettii]